MSDTHPASEGTRLIGVGTNYPSRPERGPIGTDRINAISGRIVDAAIKIHIALGPGLFEAVYEAILARNLARSGLSVERQRRVPITYEGLCFEEGFRADLIVEECVIVEVKSVEHLAPVHVKQLLTYAKLLDFRLGLLLNFGAPVMTEGIRRVANRL